MNKEKIMNELTKHGFLDDDPRLKELRNKFKTLVKTPTINYEEFFTLYRKSYRTFTTIFQRKLIIPKFQEFKGHIESIYEKTLSCKRGS